MITPTLFFISIIFVAIIPPVYAEWDYVWYGYPETGYYKSPIIYEIEKCDHRNANGCIIGSHIVVIKTANLFDPYGCHVRDHEWFHLMGYEEWQIPRCNG